MKRFTAALLLMCLLLCLMCGCGAQKSGAETDNRIKITATCFPAYDLARELGGEDADVTMLLDPGMEAHNYDPSPKDIVGIMSSDVFIYIGGESESWAEDLIADIEAQDVTVIRLIDSVDLLGEDGEDDEYDEHIWTSPVNDAEMAEYAAAAMEESFPEYADAISARCDAYTAKLSELSDEFAEVAEVSGTLVFADRFPFKYLTEEYGFSCIAAFSGCSDQTEASAAKVAEIVNFVRDNNVKYVFYTEFSNMLLADTVCEETGAGKLMLHSCHNVSKEDFEAGCTYLSLMENNLAALKKAAGEG